MKLGHPLSRSS